MRKLLSYLRLVIVIGTRIVYYHLRYFIRFSKNPNKYPLEYRYEKTQAIMKAIIKHFHSDLHIEGMEKIDKIEGKVLFIANHQSEADPVLFMAMMKKPIAFLAKEEALKMPFVGKVLKAMNGITLDRANVMNQLDQIKSAVNLIKDEKEPNVAIFAEGTRNRHPENNCLEFKGGSLKLGYMANAIIVPVSIWGTYRLFTLKHYLRRYPVYVKFDDPIYPKDYENIKSVDLADTLRKQINNNVNQMRLLDKKEVFAQRLSKKRRLYETINDKIPSNS